MRATAPAITSSLITSP